MPFLKRKFIFHPPLRQTQCLEIYIFLLLIELNPIKISEMPIRPCNGPNVMETGVGGKFRAVKL